MKFYYCSCSDCFNDVELWQEHLRKNRTHHQIDKRRWQRLLDSRHPVFVAKESE